MLGVQVFLIPFDYLIVFLQHTNKLTAKEKCDIKIIRLRLIFIYFKR